MWVLAVRASLVAQMVESAIWLWQTWVWEDPLEKEIANHSSILALKIPWMKDPSRLQPMGLQRVGHDRATSLSINSSWVLLVTWLGLFPFFSWIVCSFLIDLYGSLYILQPNPGIKPRSPALQTDSLPTELSGKPYTFYKYQSIYWFYEIQESSPSLGKSFYFHYVVFCLHLNFQCSWQYYSFFFFNMIGIFKDFEKETLSCLEVIKIFCIFF